jgi:hypothetical protein
VSSKKENSSDSYLTNANVASIAEQMLALEEKNAKRWSKKPAVKRGEDLREILIKKFPEIDENGIWWFAIWVDLYLYVKDLLVCGDEIFALMNVDEAITALQSYESENPEAFEYIVGWAGEFGCLLTEGISSDIGAWFHDWFWDPLDSIGALQYENSLFIENPTPAKLTKLSKSKSVRDRVLVAFHNGTSEDLLTALSDDENVAVRFAVARNPGTPGDVLDKLVKDDEAPVKKAALANPSIFIESLISIDGDEAKISLASSNKVSSEVLAKLAKEKNEDIRAAVAENRNTASETLIALAKDKSDDVRGNVAVNRSSSMETIKMLCRDKDYLIRGSIALREDISSEIFEILSKDSDEWVRENVAENRKVPEEVLKVLSKDLKSSVRDAALKNTNLSDGSIETFENPIAVKLRLAENPSTPIDILESLITDGESIYYQGTTTSLTAAVAGNPSITDSLMSKLVKSKNDQVKKALAGNPSLTSKYLDVLVSESRKKIAAGKWDYNNRGLELGLACNPSAPAAYLIELAGHIDSWIVAAVASNPNMPPAQLVTLGKSEDLHVRQGVAANPKAPWALLKSLSKEGSCLWYICKNPATRAEELVEIANQSVDEHVLSDIAKHSNTPMKLIEKLANHKEAWVRLGVADNPNTPSAVREKILDDFLTLKFEENDGDEYVARCFFSTEKLFENVFGRYLPMKSQSRSRILGYIATNPNAPAEILTRLASDRFSEIRIAVASNPSTPIEVLRQLSR